MIQDREKVPRVYKTRLSIVLIIIEAQLWAFEGLLYYFLHFCMFEIYHKKINKLKDYSQ